MSKENKIISIIGLVLFIPVVVFIVLYAMSDDVDKITKIKVLLGGVATIAIYSMLYKENPIFRMAEHIFIGLGLGYGVVMTYNLIIDVYLIKPLLEGKWLWMWTVPLAIMGYFVFSKKNAWISRIPLGMFIGFGAGTIFQGFAQAYFPQIRNSMKPLLPNINQISSGMATQPGINDVTIDRAINNVIFLITLVAVMVYFFFAFEQKNKVVARTALFGRWMLMIGFGAIFGSTIMTRFALLVDRMYFVLIEWLHLAK